MTKREKILEKIKQNPRNVSFNDLDRILRQHGFKCRQLGSGSSHYTYLKDDIRITLPKQNPMRPVYVKITLKAIEEIEE
ncbi:hypothetical protein MGLY_19550 [Neomoorella glycerini]|uniref:HicA toxin of bacterial toxin-antitoxin n=1 Tax=Neomoorella glycerini TaxID=55779 RepID=A0A6I5ZS86_9FIRM|nr:hypothetical protein MGLY_19550 [Moorella glycerini]